MITVVVLVIAAVIKQASGESDCCPDQYVILHVCLALPNEQHMPSLPSKKSESRVTGNLVIGSHYPIYIKLPKLTDKNEYWIRNSEDKYRPKCMSRFCADGSDAIDAQCGVGKCNSRGCKCKGGCRKNQGISPGAMSRQWRFKHMLTEQSRNKEYKKEHTKPHH